MRNLFIIFAIFTVIGCNSEASSQQKKVEKKVKCPISKSDRAAIYQTGTVSNVLRYVIVTDSASSIDQRPKIITELVQTANTLLIKEGYYPFDSLSEQILSGDKISKESLQILMNKYALYLHETINEETCGYMATLCLGKTKEPLE